MGSIETTIDMQSDESTAINAPTHTSSGVTQAAEQKGVEQGCRRWDQPICLPKVYALQVTPAQPIRSSERKEDHNNPELWMHTQLQLKTKSMFAVCSRETDSRSDKQARFSSCDPQV